MDVALCSLVNVHRRLKDVTASMFRAELAGRSSETSVNINRTTRCKIPEGNCSTVVAARAQLSHWTKTEWRITNWEICNLGPRYRFPRQLLLHCRVADLNWAIHYPSWESFAAPFPPPGMNIAPQYRYRVLPTIFLTLQSALHTHALWS